MSATNISGSEFDSTVIKPKKSAVVFFWASWDGSCKSFMPIFEQSADENSPKLFYKLDVDGNASTTSQYGIRAVPTVMMFKDGQASAQLVGAVTKAKLNDFVTK